MVAALISSLLLLMSTSTPVGGACDASASGEMVTTIEGSVEVHRPASTFIGDPCLSPSLEGLPKIVSNVNRTWEVQKTGSIPVSAAPDIVGAFRFICQPGQLNWDDAIVYPGQVGGSPHLHQWFGNSLANGQSTYKSLRTTGESTCMGPMNRSAYWQPAMMTEQGQVVRPDWISIYYKRIPKTNPECGPAGKNCLPLPRGLRYIFGFDMKRLGQEQSDNQIFHWKCITPGNQLRGGLEIRFDKLDCPAGHTLMVTMSSPDCWDGKYLDSADHRSHVVHRKNNPNNGRAECPLTHPYILPQFTIGASYSIMAGEKVSDWHLSSDQMPGMPTTPSGSSFHADWYGAWDDEVLKTWTDNCIDKLLNCSAGELGDGTILRRPDGYGLVAKPRLVAAPTRPADAPPMMHARTPSKKSRSAAQLERDSTASVKTGSTPKAEPSKIIKVNPGKVIKVNPVSTRKTGADGEHQMEH